MHKEILSKEQFDLLPFIKLFSKDFYLVGGTAVALHIGHRRSIDFDLFTDKLRIKAISIKTTIAKEYGLAKFKVHPNEGFNFGTINLGSFLLK